MKRILFVAIIGLIMASKSNAQDLIENIFKGVDTIELKRCIEQSDEVSLIRVLEPSLIKVANYMDVKYEGLNIKSEVKEYPLEVAVLGIFQLVKEKNYNVNDLISGQMRTASEPGFDCFSAALGSLLGISEVNSLYYDFTHGVSPRTVFRTMKTMLRRVAGAITIAWTVVELTLCLFD